MRRNGKEEGVVEEWGGGREEERNPSKWLGSEFRSWKRGGHG